MSKGTYRWKKDATQRAIVALLKVIETTLEVIESRFSIIRKGVQKVSEAIASQEEAIDGMVEHIVRERTIELKREVDSLRKQLKERPSGSLAPVVDESLTKRASTICVFDTLLFSIENWSTDGQVASDVSLCSQSILFPLVYEPVMKGDDDYYLDTFPTVSLEIVRRGREFIKWLRSESPTSLSDRDTWDVYADSVREWWVNDALPLIYGARSDDWVVSSAYDYDQMIKWRDLPASRALEFPLIFDAMELMSKQMDNIRQPVGLPDFSKKQIQTQLEP